MSQLSSRWGEVTRAVGPWPGGGRQDLNYDIGILGAGYDPYNVLTCLCRECGAAWSYDSPYSLCPTCEREYTVKLFVEENEALRREVEALRALVPAGSGAR